MNQKLKEEIAEMYASFCSGLADPNRILILYTLAEGPHNVGDLAAALNMAQPTVSRHLKTLRDRNIVTAERDGQSVIYTVSDHRIIDALDLLRAVVADQLQSRRTLEDAVVSGSML